MSQDDSKQVAEAAAPDAARRELLVRSAAVSLAAAAGQAAAAPRKKAAAAPAPGAPVVTDVEIKTGDGVCDAAFIHPVKGSYPGVIIWTDIFGLRPAMRELGTRLAAEGYAVLVPNPFYRTNKGPVVADASRFDFQDPPARTKMLQWSASIHQPGAAARDTEVFVSFLDAQPQVNRAKPIGTQGYCMGGPLIVMSAAEEPDRIGAAASFHGGGLVTDKPDSPHLLAPKIKAHMYFGIAASDDERQPEAKDKLKEAFGSRAEVEVYPGTIHGWCVPDMPQQDGKPIYSKVDAERAWSKLLALYKTYLV
jgi:carboxymethylenebutenolidase